MGELVEESVVAFVGGPDGHVVAPGDAALRGLPEEFRVRVFGEFVEADIAAVNRHGLRMSRESNDARAVVEFDVADFDFLGNRTARGVSRTGQFERVFAVRDMALVRLKTSTNSFATRMYSRALG